jgi:hypothetical protein
MLLLQQPQARKLHASNACPIRQEFLGAVQY